MEKAKKQNSFHIGLRGVVYQEGTIWIAHCLEMDIVSEGGTAEEAVRNIMDLCALQAKVAIEEGDFESIFRPAPAWAWKQFFMGTYKKLPKKPAKPIDEFETRELVLV